VDSFLHVVASNGAIAAALAVVVATVSRFRVNPAVVHILWLLVLAKLFAPPVLPVGIPWPGEAERRTSVAAVSESELAEEIPVAEPVTVLQWLSGLPWQRILLAVWIAGSLAMAAWHTVRIVFVHRLFKHASAAPEFLRSMAQRLCATLGITRCPELLTLPVRVTPAVWSLGGRPRVVFPADLVQEMDRDHLETLLAHELAHVRRRDHLVRLVELAATTVFWWHPVVWWGRTQLREMEEHACDAVVLRTVPHGARAYAMALVETLDFLNVQPGPLPIGATAASPTVSLKRRIEMLKYGSSRKITTAAVMFGAALFLPAMTLALAAEPRRTIEITSETDDEGEVTMKVVVAGIPPEELGPERMKALIALLGKDGEPRKKRGQVHAINVSPEGAQEVVEIYVDRVNGEPGKKMKVVAVPSEQIAPERVKALIQVRRDQETLHDDLATKTKALVEVYEREAKRHADQATDEKKVFERVKAIEAANSDHAELLNVIRKKLADEQPKRKVLNLQMLEEVAPERAKVLKEVRELEKQDAGPVKKSVPKEYLAKPRPDEPKKTQTEGGERKPEERRVIIRTFDPEALDAVKQKLKVRRDDVEATRAKVIEDLNQQTEEIIRETRIRHKQSADSADKKSDADSAELKQAEQQLDRAREELKLMEQKLIRMRELQQKQNHDVERAKILLQKELQKQKELHDKKSDKVPSDAETEEAEETTETQPKM